MPNFNQVILMGNMTRDWELRYTPKGQPVAVGSLAINRKWTSEAGEKKEAVTFVDITAWGRQAETLAQYTKKGNPLYVVGRLDLDQWDDKQTGQKRSKLKVTLTEFQFLAFNEDTDRDTDGPPEHQARQPAPGRAAPPMRQEHPPAEFAPPEDDDVPF